MHTAVLTSEVAVTLADADIKGFSSSLCVQTSSEAPSSKYQGSFPTGACIA
jgi:hypothetical protein